MKGPSRLTLAALLSVCTLALSTLASCDLGESNVSAGNRASVLHVGNGSEPQSLDPHVISGLVEWNIVGALFEGLVTRNPWTLELEPGVAEHWQWSADRLAVRFHLNRRAKWSNGDPVTAHDFVWSWQRSLSPALGNQTAFNLFSLKNARAYHVGDVDDPDAVGVRALDAHTLEVTLEKPNPYLLENLAHFSAIPVHRATIEAHGNPTDRFTRWTRVGNMVNNGPFGLAEWKLHRRIVLERSESYWNANRIDLNAIVFYPVENEITEEKMFRAGQLHATSRVPNGKIRMYRGYANTPYREAPMLGAYYYLLNTTRPPLDDIRVREALALSIDRRRLVSTILQDAEVPSYTLTPKAMPTYDPPTILRHDEQRARILLAEAGYPSGKGWPGLELLYNTSENHRKVAVAIQQMWKDGLGIEVTLKNQEWKVYLDSMDVMDFEVARAGWIGNIDPASILSTFTSDSHVNRAGFSDPEFDEIIRERYPRAPDRAGQQSLLRQAETILMSYLPAIPLYTPTTKHLVQPGVKGMPANAMDIYNFRYVSLDPDAGVWRRPE
jgi:oligopeptide transport system substrate-binding protein